MREDIQGQGSHNTGDINLAAAIMSQGAPLDRFEPVSLVFAGGSKYSSFQIPVASIGGNLDTSDLMDAWSGHKSLPQDHGFNHVCRFIRARPRGVQRSEDLLDFAVEYLTEKGQSLPGLRKLEDIPSFVEALPESEASHVLAYVFNREICFQLHNRAVRKSYHTSESGGETRRAILDTQLPKWKSRELLSRLQG